MPSVPRCSILGPGGENEQREKKTRRKSQRQQPPRRPSVDIDQVLDQGEQLINDQRFAHAWATGLGDGR